MNRHAYLRTAQLNAVGWSALIGGSVAVGLLFVKLGLPVWLGVVLMQGIVVSADRAKWAKSSSSVSWTDDLADVQAAADRLGMRGVKTEIDQYGGRPSLVYRNRDWRKVRAVLPMVTIRP